jgi:hypothetical protein
MIGPTDDPATDEVPGHPNEPIEPGPDVKAPPDERTPEEKTPDRKVPGVPDVEMFEGLKSLEAIGAGSDLALPR